MPKPIFQDNGSGMHVHQSLWKGGKNLFFERGTYADLRPMALHYIGGMLETRAGTVAFCAPNHELVPAGSSRIRGADQPDLFAAQSQRGGWSAAISRSEKAKRIEVRFRIRQPTVTWRSAPCSWQVWTASEQDCAARTARKDVESGKSGVSQDAGSLGSSTPSRRTTTSC